MDSVLKTVKLPKPLAAALSRAAKARECSESDLIREGIQRVLETDDGLDMAALIGTGTDGSTLPMLASFG